MKAGRCNPQGRSVEAGRLRGVRTGGGAGRFLGSRLVALRVIQEPEEEENPGVKGHAADHAFVKGLSKHLRIL